MGWMELHYKAAAILVKLLDNQFKIFKFRFGLDPLLGLFPFFGDLISLLISTYIIWIGLRMGLSPDKIAAMVRNILVDFLVGSIPVVGDVSDFIIKANSRNLEILRKYRQSLKTYEGEIIKP